MSRTEPPPGVRTRPVFGPAPAALALLLGLALGSPAPARADGTDTATAERLLVGEYELPRNPVVDGDTLRVEPREAGSKEPSVRILCLDTEETFKGSKADIERDRAEAEKDFAAYAKRMRKEHPGSRPGTPAGEAAKEFAKAFFKEVSRVRLERDEVEAVEKDEFGRTLAHVVVVKTGGENAGKDVLYAEECVRAGWSPYHVKFGRSQRFDARLKKAQEEARAAKRGIWGNSIAHYDGYAERMGMAEDRAKQVDAWIADYQKASDEGRRSMARLGAPVQMARLRERLGRRVTVFGALDDKVTSGRPRLLLFVDAPQSPFTVRVPDDSVWRALELGKIERRYCRVTGVLSDDGGRLGLTLLSATDLDHQ